MPNKSYGYKVVAHWVPWAVSTLVIALRVLVRRKLRNSGIEDYLMCTTWLLTTIATVVTQALFYYVYFPDDPPSLLINELASTKGVLFQISSLLGRLSVAFLLLRLIGPTSRWQRALLSVMVPVVLVNLPVMILTVVPPCPSDDTMDSRPYPEATCVSNIALYLGVVDFTNFTNCVVDVIFSILPTVFVARLNMRLGKKLSIAVVLGLGWTASVVLILRSITNWAWPDDPKTQDLVSTISSPIENNLIIICGTLATLLPLFEYWFKGKPLDPRTQAVRANAEDARRLVEEQRDKASRAQRIVELQHDSVLDTDHGSELSAHPSSRVSDMRFLPRGSFGRSINMSLGSRGSV